MTKQHVSREIKQLDEDSPVFQQYADALARAKAWQVPRLEAGDANSRLEQMCRLLDVEPPALGSVQQHVQGWCQIMLEQGFTEITECTPAQAAVCVLLVWYMQQKRTKPTAMDKYQAGARIVNERRAAVLEEFKQQKESNE
ncbi:hypothetical protein Q8309_001378 [Salmonella enterica]|nr:hypothetical protein [Salmonella enterica]